MTKKQWTPTVGEASEQPRPVAKKQNPPLTVYEMAVFSMLGAMMYVSKLLLEWAPNMHLIALFTIVFTVVYRAKALIPIYIFVLLSGVFGGISAWWMPYLYIWALLWGAVMLLPRRMPAKIAAPVFVALGTLHGLLFGVFCAPSQALFFGLDFRGTLAWIAAGFYFDLLHAIGNFAACTLCIPLIKLILNVQKRIGSR